MSKVKIYDAKRITATICERFRKYVTEALDEVPDIFTEHYKKMFFIDIIPTSVLFIEDELFAMDKKSFSRKVIINTYNDNLMKRNSSPAYAHMHAKTDDKGNLVLTSLFIRVNYDLIILDAIRNLYRLPQWCDTILRTHARHEVGHIIDYIQSYDGQPAEKLKKDNEACIKANDEWMAWWKEKSDNGKKVLPIELEKERLIRYFQIPTEATADRLGKVDREKAIDFMVNSTDKCVDIIIKSKERPNPQKEEKKSEDVK